MIDPTIMSPGSIMPAYAFMTEKKLDVSSTPDKINAMRKLGVPYPEGYEKQAIDDLIKQANEITADLVKSGVGAKNNTEIIAIIAYLQRLGIDIKGEKTVLN